MHVDMERDLTCPWRRIPCNSTTFFKRCLSGAGWLDRKSPRNLLTQEGANWETTDPSPSSHLSDLSTLSSLKVIGAYNELK